MFSIARSRFTLPSQLAFLIVNAFALVLGLIYNHKTPQLYENSSHTTTGWAITWIASAWVFMALIQTYTGPSQARSTEDEEVQQMTTANMARYQRVQDEEEPDPSRWSNDSGQGTERNSASLFSHSRSPSVESENQQFAGPTRKYTHDDLDSFDEESEKRGFLRNKSVDNFISRSVARFAVGRTLKVMRFFYVLCERTILIQGLVAIANGTVVYGGIGVSFLQTLGVNGANQSCAERRGSLQRTSSLHQGRNLLPLRPPYTRSMDGSIR